ncbi:hypothetical protein BDF20DRAFT_426240 [Mycotypha africana]|uniref:uncharacterized protein n=1 Tax=Mycotypha africana TaxID=64632 RepID=UPI002300EBFC|nr:uncharacterized protein BDF20DRAFT_426240 [Mycotypha africana]KAI8981749.1 hypothetical protein BDF20DRAFT_426240 [Mycotypha africana]
MTLIGKNGNYHSNHDPSEADSPDSGSGSSNHRRTESYPTQEPTTLSQGDQKQRRKEQNRAAQRAFRERKERYVKELQLKIKEMEKKHGEELKRVNDENERLKDLVKKMEIEIYTLKGAAMAFNMSINKLREAGLDVSHPAPPNASTTTTVHTPTTPPHQHQFTNRRPSPPVPRSSSATTTTTTSALDQLLSDSSSSVSTPVESAQSLPLRLQQRQQQRNSKGQTMFTDDELMMGDKEDNNGADEEDNDNFVERDAYRFKQHRPVDPSLLPTSSAVKMIPCSQIWERLSQHPNFDEFDLDKLCEELKKKAKCSGNGPVIPEYELQEVLRRMDNRMI